MSDEDRSALYKIRWEVLVVAVSLILSVVTVLAIPNDFSDKMLREQKQQKELEKNLIASDRSEGLSQVGQEKQP